MKLTIKVFENDLEIASQQFVEGTYIVGRSEECDLVLANEKVSRKHLEVRVTAAAVYLSNLSTSGRVFYKGESLETAEAANGDSFRVGPYHLITHMSSGSVARESQVFDLPGDGEIPPNVAGSIGEGIPEENQLDDPGPVIDLNDGNIESHAAVEMADMQPVGDGTQGSAALSLSDTQVQIKPLVAKLIFTTGPNSGQEFFLETYEIVFGRSKRADIFLDDHKLSRLHAKISRVGSGYRLIDLGSRNGTYVNGMRILEHPLSSFDEISLGNSKIKFIIHDMAGQLDKGETGVGLRVVEETKSMQMDPARQAEMLEQVRAEAPPPAYRPPVFSTEPSATDEPKKSFKLTYILLMAVAAGLGLLFLLPGGEQTSEEATQTPAAETVQTPTPGVKAEAETRVATPSAIPQEYNELSAQTQRAIEGYYQSALRAAERGLFEEGIFNLRQIHEKIRYYKDSRDLYAEYQKKIKEQQIRESEQRAKTDEKQDLEISVNEGLQYLKESNFERAEDAFNAAIVIDPNNEVALKGLKAAQKRVKDINNIPPDVDPEQEKRNLVAELFKSAVDAFKQKSYQEAIDIAEQIRKIELKGESKYLSEAKQIIDLARMQQKEEFEPFLIQAKEKYAEGDYNTSRDLCEEMVKRDPAYTEAGELLKRVKRQMNNLAKEAYTTAIILESLDKLDEAVQYWNRAKNYVRPGDDYFEKINKKLENYQ